MRETFRAGAGVVAMVCWLGGGVTMPQAAGALAIGSCAAYGYAYDFPTLKEAQDAALENCAGACKQVVTTEKGCVAFAVDGHKPCGPHGFANAARLGKAQNTALHYCYKYGGRDCMIRAWICDSKG
jgi:hypothetical protein